MYMIEYNITRHNKTNKEVRYLSQNKKRWLVLNSKQRFAVMNESEAREFCASKEKDIEYYYFRTQRIK